MDPRDLHRRRHRRRLLRELVVKVHLEGEIQLILVRLFQRQGDGKVPEMCVRVRVVVKVVVAVVVLLLAWVV